jgi:hypothetical protein
VAWQLHYELKNFIARHSFDHVRGDRRSESGSMAPGTGQYRMQRGGWCMKKKAVKKKAPATPVAPHEKKKPPKRKDACNPVFLYEWPKR